MFKKIKQRPKRWTLVLLAVLVAVGTLRYLHWDDRLLFLWQEHSTSAQQQEDIIWLPGYRAVIQAKPLEGLAEAQT